MDVWTNQLQTAILQQQGNELAELLCPMSYPMDSSLAVQISSLPESVLESKIKSSIKKPWDRVVLAFCKCFRMPTDAWSSLFDAVNAMFSEFAQIWTFKWHNAVLHMLSHTLYGISVEADAETGHPQKLFLAKTRTRLSSLLNQAMNEKSPYPETRSGVFILMNFIMKFLFELHELSLCPKLIAQVEPVLNSDIEFTPSERITYHYYVGRYRLFEHEFADSDRHLTWSFDRCPAGYAKNKRLVRGNIPLIGLLEKYQMAALFGPLVNAFKVGHFSRYIQHLDQFKHVFVRRNVYGILRWRTETLILRNLLHSIYTLYKGPEESMDLNDHSATGPVQIPLQLVLHALGLAGCDAWTWENIQEVESMAVGLIDEFGDIFSTEDKRCKWVVHHTCASVLAAKTPFPIPYDVYTAKFSANRPLIT